MHVRYATGVLLAALTVSAVGCKHWGGATGLPVSHNLPPAQQIMEPGPGVGGPGPGVLPPPYGGPPPAPAPHVQVAFNKPTGMQIQWDVTGIAAFDSQPLIAPGRKSFPQGGIYHLKLTNIEGREGVELYPTLEVGPTTPRTAAYLGHTAIPVQFTDEDLDQVLSGNFVTKVIYLPDPEFQELAIAGVDTLVSTRLDPGVDPIVEADRRGAILAIVRIGNKDLEIPQGNGGRGPGVIPVSHAAVGPNGQSLINAQGPAGPGAPLAAGPLPYSTGSVVPNYISGVTAPPYGMPYVGTPIGLPGPAHIPLGVPAGLQRHAMHNHTHMHIPGPTRHMNVHVKQKPGLSYPAPANKAYIKEHTIRPTHINRQPPHNITQGVRPAHPGLGHGAGCPCQHCQP